MKRMKNVLLALLVGAAVFALRAPARSGIFTKLPAGVRNFFTIDKVVTGRWQFFAACIGWVIFSLYWEATAGNSAQAQNAESKNSRRFHVALTNLAMLLVILPFDGVGRFIAVSSVAMTAGVSIEALGLFLAIWARRSLGQNWSGEISIKVEHRVVRTGPYRWLRHPIYTGLLMMYIGAAFVTGVWLAAVGVLIALLAYWRKLRLEEQSLIKAFGAQYEAYRHETWSLVPGIY